MIYKTKKIYGDNERIEVDCEIEGKRMVVILDSNIKDIEKAIKHGKYKVKKPKSESFNFTVEY